MRCLLICTASLPVHHAAPSPPPFQPVNSSRGRGIRMVARPQDITRDVKDVLVQHYIHNPLLIGVWACALWTCGVDLPRCKVLLSLRRIVLKDMDCICGRGGQMREAH